MILYKGKVKNMHATLAVYRFIAPPSLKVVNLPKEVKKFESEKGRITDFRGRWPSHKL